MDELNKYKITEMIKQPKTKNNSFKIYSIIIELNL